MPKEPEKKRDVTQNCCAICGQALTAYRRSFAVTQNFLEDRVSVFHWKDVVHAAEVRGACGPKHVRELVVHWMVTGRLDHPFARSVSKREAEEGAYLGSRKDSNAYVIAAVPIGELSVDRESVCRLLDENPGSLGVILDELHEALERSIDTEPLRVTMADLSDNRLHHT